MLPKWNQLLIGALKLILVAVAYKTRIKMCLQAARSLIENQIKLKIEIFPAVYEAYLQQTSMQFLNSIPHKP